MKKWGVLILAASTLLGGCNKVDNRRIPFASVRIALDNDGLWSTYGVSGFGDYRRFIKSERVPANFTYTALTYTGYGGVLLVSGKQATGDGYGYPLAYDLACPVEARQNVRLKVNAMYEAECPECGSRYNITEAMGAPVAGKALDYGYGLTRYNVNKASSGGYTITN